MEYHEIQNMVAQEVLSDFTQRLTEALKKHFAGQEVAPEVQAMMVAAVVLGFTINIVIAVAEHNIEIIMASA